MTTKVKRRLLLAGIIAGGLMMLSPFAGLIGTVLGMKRAFHEMGTSGISDPGHLSAAIGETLISTAAGIIIAVPGVVIFITCLVLSVLQRRTSPPDVDRSES